MWYDELDFKILEGKILSSVEKRDDGTELIFTLENGEQYKLWHDQDCCEHVCIDDICGDLNDLVGIPILNAEVSTSNKNPRGVKPPERYQESFTWTFYRISTEKGTVVVRWYGGSNGYYSEEVSFNRIESEENET